MGLHTDRRNHEGIPDGYVQGLVNLIPTSAASGGNVIIPKSHKYVDDLDEVRSLMKEGQSFYECAKHYTQRNVCFCGMSSPAAKATFV